MSLQNKIKLTDLKEKATELYKLRDEVRQEKLEKAIDDVKSDFSSYLTSVGFESKDNTRSKVLEASYKNNIFVSLKYESADQAFMGCDTAFELTLKGDVNSRNDKTLKAILLMQSERLPSFSYAGSVEGKEIKELEFYESTLIPALEAIGVSDITGEYTLGMREEKSLKINTMPIKDIVDLIMA